MASRSILVAVMAAATFLTMLHSARGEEIPSCIASIEATVTDGIRTERLALQSAADLEIDRADRLCC